MSPGDQQWLPIIREWLGLSETLFVAGVGRGSHQGHVAPPAGWRNIMNIVSDPEDYAGLDWLYKVPASAGDAILFTEVDTTSVHDRFYPFYFNGLVGIVLRLENFCVIMIVVGDGMPRL